MLKADIKNKKLQLTELTTISNKQSIHIVKPLTVNITWPSTFTLQTDKQTLLETDKKTIKLFNFKTLLIEYLEQKK